MSMFSYYKLHQVYLTLRVSMIVLLGLTKPRVAFNASLDTLGFVMLRFRTSQTARLLPA